MQRQNLLITLGIAIALGACGSVAGDADAGSTGDATTSIDAATTPDATQALAPTLAAVTPPRGPVGASVTLTGTNFGTVQGTSTVSFGAELAAIGSWSNTTIEATVPDLLPAAVDVTVTTLGGTTGPRSFAVILPPMVYINSQQNDPLGSNTITVMRFDPATGALTEAAGSPVSLGTPAVGYGGCASSILVHVPTRRLFATGDAAVAVFDIDPMTGALTAATNSPFATGSNQAYGLAINTAGTRLFNANYAGTVSVYNVAADGQLTPVPNSPFLATSVDTPVLSRNEEFLYVNNEANGFEGYSIAADGQLARLAGSPFASGGFSFAAAGRPGADQLILPVDSVGLAIYNLNPTTGLPTALANSPFAFLPPVGTIHHPVFTGDGNRMYVATWSGTHVQAFNVAIDGTPTPIASSPFDFGPFSGSCLHVSRDSSYLLSVGSSEKSVAVFGLAANGAPTQVVNSPFAYTTPNSDPSGLAATF